MCVSKAIIFGIAVGCWLLLFFATFNLNKCVTNNLLGQYEAGKSQRFKMKVAFAI